MHDPNTVDHAPPVLRLDVDVVDGDVVHCEPVGPQDMPHIKYIRADLVDEKARLRADILTILRYTSSDPTNTIAHVLRRGDQEGFTPLGIAPWPDITTTRVRLALQRMEREGLVCKRRAKWWGNPSGRYEWSLAARAGAP